jgi:iron complex transport system permease protein
MVDKTQVTLQSNPETNIEEEKTKYRKVIAKRNLFLAICVVLLIIIAGIALSLGSANMTFLDAYVAIFERAFPDWFHASSPVAYTVVWTLRLPRILLAVLAGAALAIGGCTTMAILKNPIATPYTLGVSSGAGLGAAIGIIMGTSLFGAEILGRQFVIISNAFIFALIPVAVVLLLSKRNDSSPHTMILAGVAMGYIFSACTTILKYFAESSALSAVVFWLVGDLNNAEWSQLPYIFGMLTIVAAVTIYLSWDINALKLGDDTAKSLGVEVDRTRKVTLILSCLLTATVVAFTGPIGFICLLAPHICKAFVGEDQRLLIISSGLVGAILLIVADIIARQLLAPILLPVGAVTAFLGGPVLLYLLIKRRR